MCMCRRRDGRANWMVLSKSRHRDAKVKTGSDWPLHSSQQVSQTSHLRPAPGHGIHFQRSQLTTSRAPDPLYQHVSCSRHRFAPTRSVDRKRFPLLILASLRRILRISCPSTERAQHISQHFTCFFAADTTRLPSTTVAVHLIDIWRGTWEINSCRLAHTN